MESSAIENQANLSELNEEIITGLFNMTRNILQNLSQRYKDNQELPMISANLDVTD